MAKAAAKAVGVTFDAGTMTVIVAHTEWASFSRSVDPCAKRAALAEAKRLGLLGGVLELRKAAYCTDTVGKDVLSEFYFDHKR